MTTHPGLRLPTRYVCVCLAGRRSDKRPTGRAAPKIVSSTQEENSTLDVVVVVGGGGGGGVVVVGDGVPRYCWYAEAQV